MKFYVALLSGLLLLTIGCTSSRSTVVIPANQTVQIDYSQYALYEMKLRNASKNSIDVKVLNKETGEFQRGFGLEGSGRADVIVERGSTLQLFNSSDETVAVKFSPRERSAVSGGTETREYISFTLANETPASIPLIIPGVMNPNLSPLSNSGVDLRPGQEIFFKHRGKRQLLLTVDDSIEEGSTIEVGKLLRQRKSELGLD